MTVMFLQICEWLEVQDAVLASCVDVYNYTSTTYRIGIPTQRKTMMSRDVKFDEDVRSSSSQDSPSMIEREREEVVILEIDLGIRLESNSRMDKVSLGMDMPSRTTPAHRKSRWITLTLHDG
jgi:hypothetical protein